MDEVASGPNGLLGKERRKKWRRCCREDVVGEIIGVVVTKCQKCKGRKRRLPSQHCRVRQRVVSLCLVDECRHGCQRLFHLDFL